jgi:hypothetical protein
MFLINCIAKENLWILKNVEFNIKPEEVKRKNKEHNVLLVQILVVDLKLKLSMIVSKVIVQYIKKILNGYKENKKV